MRIDDDELRRFCIAWVRSENNATEALKKIRPERKYTTGSAFVVGHRVLSTAKRHPQFAEWCALGAAPKPVPKPKPAILPTVSVTPPPDELRAVRRIDAETLRRERLAEFLSVPLAEIPELMRGGFRPWYLEDRLAPFRGSPLPGSDRLPLCMTYVDDPAIRENWRKKNHRQKAGWTFNETR